MPNFRPPGPSPPSATSLSAGAPSLVLIGGGGHAAVVAEAAALAGVRVGGFLDDDPAAPLAVLEFRLPHPFPGPPCLGPLRDLSRLARRDWIIALGQITPRRGIIEALSRANDSNLVPGSPITIIHPCACISPSATIGPGCFIGPLALVHSRARIGPHVIINSGAIVEHDCAIEENVHIAPGAVLGGNVSVGEDTLIGLGSRVLPGITVGPRCTIGAGAVVTRPVRAGATVTGVPAREHGQPAKP